MIERSVINTRGAVLRLPEMLTAGNCGKGQILSLVEMETAHIKRALKRTKGKVYGRDGAAKLLKINPDTLRAKMKKLGIQKDHFEVLN